MSSGFKDPNSLSRNLTLELVLVIATVTSMRSQDVQGSWALIDFAFRRIVDSGYNAGVIETGVFMKYQVAVALALMSSLFAAGTVCALDCGHLLSSLVVVNAAADGSDAEQDSYPRVAAIENALFGQSYASDDLEARLTRLEEKAFGKTSPNVDLADRTDALQQFAEKKLNRKLFKEDPEFESTTYGDGSNVNEQQDDSNASSGAAERSQGGSPNRMRSVGTTLGTTLLNVAGLGVPGFGGVRVRNRADLPAQEQAAIKANQRQKPQEDPAVFAKDPPPDSAKLLTRVGWCEMQIWGHTFPAMHLTQRLNQLNGEVNFAPGKTGIALMDCSAAMIKATRERAATEDSQ